jgi:hypothetical protein
LVIPSKAMSRERRTIEFPPSAPTQNRARMVSPPTTASTPSAVSASAVTPAPQRTSPPRVRRFSYRIRSFLLCSRTSIQGYGVTPAPAGPSGILPNARAPKPGASATALFACRSTVSAMPSWW